MGLFSNSKKPCPICGSATPRLFPTSVEGIPICRECGGKIQLPKGVFDGMSLDDFRQYMAYYQQNQALQDIFEEGFQFNFSGGGGDFQIDLPKRLFRLSADKRALVMEDSCLKSFRILENDKVLFESSPEGLKSYESDIPARAREMAPLVSQFQILKQQYEYIEEMEKIMKEKGIDRGNLSRVERPEFQSQPITQDIVIEMTLEHPYWGGKHSWSRRAARFDRNDPSVQAFLRSYQKEMENLHAMAVNLMLLINPDAPEVHISLDTPAGGSAERALPIADPVAEIQKYKGLLDSGAITEEEFSAKKRQLLGI